MAGLLLKNANIVTPDCTLTGDIAIDDGRIIGIAPEIQPSDEVEIIDCDGGMALPGFVDLHIHGSVGVDFTNPDVEGIHRVADHLATKGVTSLLATTAGETVEHIVSNCTCIVRAMRLQERGARIRGIHLEGPFFSKESPAIGANNPEWLRLPDLEIAERFLEASKGHLRLFDIAPELPGAREVICLMSDAEVIVSAAHTDATYNQARESFDWGISHLTHAFNGMRRLHHREPGMIGAALDDGRIWVEVIADGQHVHPAMIKLLYRMKGPAMMGVVTDSTMLAGLKPGTYKWLGTEIVLEERRAYLKESGTLAGSVASSLDLFRNLLAWGYTAEEASRLLAANPANHLGWDDIGSLEIGKAADIVLLKDNQVALTIIDGEIEHRT